ncbi:MAG: ECF-type sigma factor [Planctomycetota bacterium]
MEDESEVTGPGEITRLLRAADDGGDEARNELFAVLHEELRRCASAMMAGQSPGHTLQATALVNEVFVRLFGRARPSWNDRRHFLMAASQAMRHLLVDHARQKAASKRDGRRIPLEEDLVIEEFESRSMGIEALDVTLRKLAETNPKMAKAVELRFFGAASQEETAEILGLSLRSFQRQWAMTRAWLFQELG